MFFLVRSSSQKYEYLENTIEEYNLKTDSLQIDYSNPHQSMNFASVISNDETPSSVILTAAS